MIECIFDWGKQHGPYARPSIAASNRVAASFLLNLIAYSLIRINR